MTMKKHTETLLKKTWSILWYDWWMMIMWPWRLR